MKKLGFKLGLGMAIMGLFSFTAAQADYGTIEGGQLKVGNEEGKQVVVDFGGKIKFASY